MSELQVCEIVRTLVGEGTCSGLPCVLVRLTGCPLRCRWCDTPYARQGGVSVPLDEVRAAVASHGPRRVLVTGGEPLAQPLTIDLLAAFVADGFEVILETSGAMDVRAVPQGVRRIVDIKTPSSGEATRNLTENWRALGHGDEVKIVVADRTDFDFAREVVLRQGLIGRASLLASPVYGQLEPVQLARWILQSGLDLRLNLQIHKVAFGPDGDLALQG